MDHIVRSINTQCCVLVGQFLVLLRTVVDTLVKLFTSQKFAFTDEYTARLHHAVVMLGRLAWKLQTYQGDFMRTAIASSSSAASRRTEGSGNVSSADSENTSTAAGGVYMTSLEQLVAAFDIADTDGDGYITYDEAVEVYKSLRVCMYADIGRSHSGEYRYIHSTNVVIFAVMLRGGNSYYLMCSSL